MYLGPHLSETMFRVYRIQDLQSRRVFGDFPKPAESDKNQYWNLVVLQYQHSNSSSVCGCVANIRTNATCLSLKRKDESTKVLRYNKCKYHIVKKDQVRNMF